MKNSKRGFVVLLVIIIILIVVWEIYDHRKEKVTLPATVNETTQQTSKNQTQVSVQATSPAYNLMSGILSSLNVKNVILVSTPLAWATGKFETPGGKMIRETYTGYSFTVTHSSAENKKIGATWKSTGQVDLADVATYFQKDLVQKGFVTDMYNSGDATFSSSQGFVKENTVCLFNYKITTPPEQVSDENPGATMTTITCADKVAK